MYDKDPAIDNATLMDAEWGPGMIGIVLATGPYHNKVVTSNGTIGWIHASWVEVISRGQ